MSKQIQFLHIIYAFGHFGGRSLKITDAAEVLRNETLDEMELGLRQIANWCRNQDATDYADLHDLASKIEMDLDR